jgi:hypothetical protein
MSNTYCSLSWAMEGLMKNFRICELITKDDQNGLRERNKGQKKKTIKEEDKKIELRRVTNIGRTGTMRKKE